MTETPSHVVALGLGSNLGDRLAQLRFAAVELLESLGDLRFSSIFETEPVHVTDQPDFLNACCTGRTSLSPRALLRALQTTERAAGREDGERYGPRTLDLDLLLYDDTVIDEPGLRVPHPRMHERAFVLVPLLELLPEWRHPVLGLTVSELAAVTTSDVVRVGEFDPALDVRP